MNPDSSEVSACDNFKSELGRLVEQFGRNINQDKSV